MKSTRMLLLALALAGAWLLAGCDNQEEVPRLKFYCGGSMRLPVQELIREFEAEHNVKVDPIYSGCGILVGEMKTGQGGDIYYACDTSFMEDAKSIGAIDTSYQIANVTRFRPVIMVKKGNPKGIKTVADMGREGIRVGLGNEEHGAVGRTAWQIVRSQPNADAILANLKVTSPTADFLATQLAEGPLDAAIIWDVVAKAHAEKADMIYIEGEVADQPIGLMSASKHPELAKKLIEFIRSDHAKEVFRKYGFIVNAPATAPDA